MRLLPVLLLAALIFTACASAPVIDPMPPEIPGPDEVVEDPVTTPDPVVGKAPLPENGDEPGNKFSPRPGDDQLSRAAAYLNTAELAILESYPVQVKLYLNGQLPTPCHELRVAIDPPDKENRIYIDVYTLVDPAVMCIQVIKDFDTTVSLGTFPAGHYSVYVNNELIGEFDS